MDYLRPPSPSGGGDQSCIKWWPETHLSVNAYRWHLLQQLVPLFLAPNPFLTLLTQQWSRLIRFVAVETSQVHIGEPVDHTLDVGLAFEQQEPIKAYEILGSALDPDSQLTATILTVKQLLAPLAPEQVGLVRGLGLNYSDHAVCFMYNYSNPSHSQ